MAINFPSSPTQGQVFNAAPGTSFVYSGGLWTKAPWTTALPKNYVVNPAFQISQPFGTTATTGGNATYISENWRVSATTTGAVTGQQIAAVTPYGSPNRLRFTINNVAGSPIGMRNVWVFCPIEGVRISDLMFGTASAKQIVVRFGFKASVTGSAGVEFTVRNPAGYGYRTSTGANTANTDAYCTLVIPGATGDTWANDNAAGVELCFSLVWGSGNTGGTTNSWTTGVADGGAAGAAQFFTVGDTLEIFDFGLYADPYKTGVAPPFVIPEITAETKRCQRYWYRAYGLHGGVASGTAVSRSGMRHPVPMRLAPTATAAGSVRFYDGATTALFSSISANTSNYWAAELDITTGGTFATGGKQACMYYQTDADYIGMNSRM